MSCISLMTFGQPRVLLEDQVHLKFPTEKTLELFVLAALSPSREITRGAAASALRGEHSEGRARKALSTDLWRLRRVFEDAGLPSVEVFQTSGQEISLHPQADIFVDAIFLETVWETLSQKPDGVLSEEEAEMARQAVAHYTGDFYATMDQEWCLLVRERLRSKHLALVNLLMNHEIGQDRWQAAVSWGEVLLEHDPLLEHAHRSLMQCHFLMGNRAVAIRQFARCKDILENELGVSPSEETLRMYRGLVSVSVEDPVPSGPERVTESLRAPPVAGRAGQEAKDRPLTDQLSMALGSLDAARSLVSNVDSRLRRGQR